MAISEYHDYDYVAENRTHYDKHANVLETDEEFSRVARQIAEGILRVHGSLFDKSSTTLMDFACGTGLLAHELYPHVKSILGVDVSTGVVDLFNQKVQARGIAPDSMQAVCTELKGGAEELSGTKFDVVLCSMTYHHFGSISAITKTLASFLRPGGSLLVVDLIDPEGTTPIFLAEQYPHLIPHKLTFSEDDVRRVFADAGLENVSFDVVMHLTSPRSRLDQDVCVARGIKAAS